VLMLTAPMDCASKCTTRHTANFQGMLAGHVVYTDRMQESASSNLPSTLAEVASSNTAFRVVLVRVG